MVKYFVVLSICFSLYMLTSLTLKSYHRLTAYHLMALQLCDLFICFNLHVTWGGALMMVLSHCIAECTRMNHCLWMVFALLFCCVSLNYKIQKFKVQIWFFCFRWDHGCISSSWATSCWLASQIWEQILLSSKRYLAKINWCR